MPNYLALDFGGTKLAAGVLDSEKPALLAHVRRQSPPEALLSIQTMLDIAREALREAGLTVESVRGVGISFGGPVDDERRKVRISHHVPGWKDQPLVEIVERELGLPVAMDNDANAQALGEWRYGAGRGTRDFLFVNVGTGIGAGVVIDGKLHRGRHNLAGELGHTIVNPGGPDCACGKRGCVESFASGPSIARAARLALSKSLAGEPLRQLSSGDPKRITGEMVFRAAEVGDALAILVLENALEHLGIGLANAAALYDPELIAIDGGVTKAGEAFFRPLIAAARRHSAPLAPDMIRIVPGELGDNANLFGALALAVGEIS